MKPYVYITRKLPEETIMDLTELFEVKMWGHEDIPAPREVILKEAQKASALITMLSDKVDEEVLSAGESLKVVANLAVGFDNIDLEAATKRGIIVTNTPDVLTETTADLTFSLLMASARRIVEAAEYIKAGKWGAGVRTCLLGMMFMGRQSGLSAWVKSARRLHAGPKASEWRFFTITAPKSMMLKKNWVLSTALSRNLWRNLIMWCH